MSLKSSPTNSAPADSPAGRPTAQIAAGLQNLRVLATLLVVAGHSLIAYLNAPQRGTIWHVYDPSSWLGFDYLAMAINAFAMPVFFFMAGASAIPACSARGPLKFFTHRAAKLVAPAIVACLTILPLSYLFWGLGLLFTERVSMIEVLRMKFSPEIQRFAYGPMHLWFLEYLVVICGIWGLAWRAGLGSFLQRPTVFARCQKWFSSGFLPLLLAIPTAAIFLAEPETMIRLANTFVPDPWRLVYYTIYFFAGAIWSRNAASDSRLATRWPLYASAAVGLFVFEGWRIVAHATGHVDRAQLMPLGISHALFGWFITLALVEGSIALAGARQLKTHYLAEASFWIYLFHHPVVAALQLGLAFVTLPAVLKFSITWLGSIAISLLAYQWLVRYSQIGAWVNGVRKRASWKKPWHAEVGWVSCVALVLIAISSAVYHYRGFIWSDNFAEVVPQEVYRCGRLSAVRLAARLASHQFQTVVCVDDSVSNEWLAAQAALCQSQHCSFRHVPLPLSKLPAPEQLKDLSDVLASCPGPVLIEGYKGLENTSLASAVALLVQCGNLELASEQFSSQYGELAGQAHTRLAHVVQKYGEWLEQSGCPTGATSFEVWACEHYPAFANFDDRGQLALRGPSLSVNGELRR